MDLVLLLTGTVNSSGISFMKRNDTQERLNDYLTAIRRWLVYPNLKIVFVENSNYPKEEFGPEIIENINFEYLTYFGQDFSRTRGKGYGEINSFEYAFEHSNFLKDAQLVLKCNGRYYFRGINKFIDDDFDVMGNFSPFLNYLDSRVFLFKPRFFFNYFKLYKDQIDDSNKVYFENALARATNRCLSEGGKWKPIPFPLIIEGYSGTFNKRYDSLLKRFLTYSKFYIKKALI